MTFKRRLLESLDRPGARGLLSRLTSAIARRQTGADVEVFFDGRWVHRVGPVFFPDGRQYRYHPSTFPGWITEAQRHLDEARDFWFRFYEPQPGDVIVDVGAGCGEDTFAFSKAVGPTGRVLALEGYPPVFELLAEFCRRNELENVVPVSTALMDQPGSVFMAEAAHWMETRVTALAGGRGYTVRAATLDEVCREQGIGEVAFVKMNIEGAERFALPGMEAMLDRIRFVCIACHDFRADHGDGEDLRTRAFVEEFLRVRGFELSFRDDDPRDYVRDHVFGRRR